MIRRTLIPMALTAALAFVSMPQARAAQEAPAKATAPAKNAALVNLNSATADELESLPGIGAQTAARIVDYRQKKGGFKKIEDLMNVKGHRRKGLPQAEAARHGRVGRGERPTS